MMLPLISSRETDVAELIDERNVAYLMPNSISDLLSVNHLTHYRVGKKPWRHYNSIFAGCFNDQIAYNRKKCNNTK